MLSKVALRETNAMNVYTKAKTNVVEVNSAGIIDVILNKEMDSTEKKLQRLEAL